MRTLNYFMAYLSCISLVLSPVVYAADAPVPSAPSGGATCEQGVQAMKKACVEDPQTTGLSDSMLTSALGADSMNSYGSQLSSAAATASNVSAQTAVACEQAGNSCKQACDNEATQKEANPLTASQGPPLRKQGEQCKSIADQLAGDYAQTAAQTAQNSGQAAASGEAAKGGSGGGGDMLMGGLLGAGLAVGAMCLMGSICKGDEEKKDGEDDGEDGGDGEEVVDCATDENAASHASCQDHFLDQCEANPASAECEDFASHYCGLNGETSGGDDTTNPTDVGAGTGSQFCQIVIATRYCESGDRETCPSCQNLSRMNSPACASNASVCLPQMTTEDKQMAQVMCPTDPIFSNPLFMADTESGEGTGDDTTTPPEGTGPSVESFMGDGTTTASVDGGGGVMGGETASDTLTGIAKKYGSSAASAVGSVGSQLSDAARSSGLVDGVKNFGLATRQIASDIAPSVGPSLFSKVSKVIAQKCQAGEVNNCGPRSFTSN